MKRYDLEHEYCQSCVTEDPDGEWIRYSDHVEAMKRIAGEGAEAQKEVSDRELFDQWAKDHGWDAGLAFRYIERDADAYEYHLEMACRWEGFHAGRSYISGRAFVPSLALAGNTNGGIVAYLVWHEYRPEDKWLIKWQEVGSFQRKGLVRVPLYAAPPAAPVAQGLLTDDEIQKMTDGYARHSFWEDDELSEVTFTVDGIVRFVRAILAQSAVTEPLQGTQEPSALTVEEGICAACRGAGQIATGCDDLSESICKACDGSGLAAPAPSASPDTYPARLLHESDASLAERVDSWHQRNPAPSASPAALTDRVQRDIQYILCVLEDVRAALPSSAAHRITTGKAIEKARALLAASPADQGEDARDAATWQPITGPGQVRIGDELYFTIGDEEFYESAKAILDPGTDKEEIIYNKRRNYYLITSMALANKGSQKNVKFRHAAPAPTQGTQEPRRCKVGSKCDSCTCSSSDSEANVAASAPKVASPEYDEETRMLIIERAAFPILKALYSELNTLRWISAVEGDSWDQAIDAVRKRIAQIIETEDK